MNRFWILTRVLFKNGTMPGREGSNRGKIALFIVVLAFLPMLALEVSGLWKAYAMIVSLHLTGPVLAVLLTAACALMVTFGILYVISTYYFADDTALLLTMPIPPYRILAAKFTVVLLFQYGLELLVAMPVLTVFGIRDGNFFYWASAVFVFAALPLLPTVVCSIISILVMAFSRFFHNKDRVKFIAGLLAVVLAVGISVGMQFLGGHSSSVRQLQNSGELMKRAAALFPSNLLAVRALLDGSVYSLLWLMGFLLLSAAAVIAFLWLGNQLYLTGVVGLTQSARHRRQTGVRVRRRPAALAIALKDWKLLIRTPAFALNCVMSAFLIPLIMVVSLASTLRGMVIPRADVLIIALGVLFLSFISMMNMASPTAISRDGRDAVVARYIPVPYKTQILGKLLPGLGMSFAALILTLVPICVLIRPDFFTAATVCGLATVSLITFNIFGLFIDVVFPKLDWDDETIAVKRNVNVAIELLTMLAALAASAFLVYKLQLDLRNGIVFLLVYYLILLAVAVWLLLQKGSMFRGTRFSNEPFGKKTNHHKIIRGAAGMVIIIVALWCVCWEFFFVHTDVKITASQLTISAGLGESSTFKLSQIKAVYLKDALPPVSGRIGYAVGAQMRGSFIVKGLGRGHVYTENAKAPFLFIMLKGGGYTIFNFDDMQRTQELYNSLKRYEMHNS